MTVIITSKLFCKVSCDKKSSISGRQAHRSISFLISTTWNDKRKRTAYFINNDWRKLINSSLNWQHPIACLHFCSITRVCLGSVQENRNKWVYWWLCQLHSVSKSITLRGHSQKYVIPFARTLAFQRSFFPDSIGLWNLLPQETVGCVTLDQFRWDL